ncbi:MAG: hypothetical protein JXA95_19590 [Spirochaetales bacterium]|nr:hypothetical protein [Spirochaetales bacterium]
MKGIIRAILGVIIVVTGFLGFYFMKDVGLEGDVALLGFTVSPLMLIVTAIVLAFILLTNFFAWIAIGAAIVLLILHYGLHKTVIEGQQMMIIYLLVFGLVDIWISKKD